MNLLKTTGLAIAALMMTTAGVALAEVVQHLGLAGQFGGVVERGVVVECLQPFPGLGPPCRRARGGRAHSTFASASHASSARTTPSGSNAVHGPPAMRRVNRAICGAP